METTTQQEKRIFLFNDTATYKFQKSKEDELKKVISKFEEIIVSNIGELAINWKSLINDPIQYVTNKYWETWGYKSHPETANKITVFENATKISASTLQGLKTKHDSIFSSLGKYAPKYFVNHIQYNVKESYFDKFLKPELRAEFEAVENFRKSAKELEKYGASGTVHLVRYCHKLQLENLEAVIDKYQYIDK